jgi:uncharacterized protein (TIGR02246 family)
MKACMADLLWTTGEYSKISARMTGKGLPIGILALIGGFLAGCGPQAVPTDPAARQAVETAMQRYVDASNKGDVATLASLYADDAVLLPPDHEPIRGREAIGAFWRQGTDEGLEVTNLAIEVDGNLGYLVGRYHLPPTDEEPADSGKYVMCLKRQQDGSWKLTADIWNQSGDEDDADDDASPSPSIT